MNIRVAGLIVSIGAITAFAFWLLVRPFLPMPTPTSSGGIGAVSSGVAEFIVEMVPISAAAIVLNLILAKRARRWGKSATRLRRVHLSVTPTLVTVPFLGPAILRWSERSSSTIFSLAYVLILGVQVLFGVLAVFMLARTADAAK